MGKSKGFFVIMDHQSPLENSNNFLVKTKPPKLLVMAKG